jgi:integrase
MRRRHSTGGVRKERGRWRGLWYENGVKKSRVLGFVTDMTKGEAREAVARIVAEARAQDQTPREFGEFVKNVYFPYYKRKWKASTAENNVNRVNTHLVGAFDKREMTGFRRDELQDFLDAKAKSDGLSFSVVAHLRWDLNQIFAMAVAEACLPRNPAQLLFVPREAKRPMRRSMTIEQVGIFFGALLPRERLIAKLALIGGMRPGEIFALTWGRLTATYADIRQRVYRRKIDTPKTDNSMRQAALSEGLLADIEAWRALAIATDEDAWGLPFGKHDPAVEGQLLAAEHAAETGGRGVGLGEFSGQCAARTRPS